MKKNKFIAALTAVSLMLSCMTISSFAADNDNSAEIKAEVLMTYDGAVKINSDSDFNAVLISAEYGANNELIAVKTTPVEVKTGSNSFNMKFANGTKLMLWNSIKEMVPMSASVTVSEATATPEVTATPEATATPANTPAPTDEPEYEPAIDLNKDTSATNKVTLYQESSSTTEEFKTLKAAIRKAMELNPQSNEERVVISLMPGVYREQNTVDTPYITIKKDDAAKYHNIEATYGESDLNKTGTYLPDANKEVILTCYYGTGYHYTSASSIEHWGSTMYVTNNATEFIAEDIVFENSFNRYMTDEEISDNVESDGGKPQRTKDSDVAADSFNERSAALYTDAERAQFIGCKMLSSQDTIGLNKVAYLKDCYIEGRTDYICGVATAVLDNCELMFYGYSDSAKSGVVTAMQYPVEGYNYGLLLFNCKLGNTKSGMSTGSLGRPWRQGAQVTYYNCIFKEKNLISAHAWEGMSEATVELAPFYEYGTKYFDGTSVDLSGRAEGKVLDDWTILEYNPRNYLSKADGTADWDPMGFADAYLKEVDEALKTATVEIPENEETTFDLPLAPAGLEYKWESASTNAVVSEDGTQITVIRPAAGEQNIETVVTLYARNAQTKYGDKKDIPVIITPTTNTSDVFTVPVTLRTSAASDTPNDFIVKILKNGAVVKQQTITVEAEQKTVNVNIENIPANEEGIDYIAEVISVNDDFAITLPEGGKATIKGIKGQNVQLDIKADMQVDSKVEANPGYESAQGNKVIDLIAFAKKNGATDGIDTSDVITVKYTLDVTPSTAGNTYIDLISGTPASSANTSGKAVPSRFVLGILRHWNQFDLIDSSQEGYSGTSNIDEHQWLNACGKFEANKPSSLAVTIDYKHKTIKAKGEGSGNGQVVKEFEFTKFPTEYEKGKLNLVVYAGGETFKLTNIEVTYKEVLTDTADTSALERTISKAKAVSNENGKYTAASYTVLQTVIGEAEEMVASKTATRDEVAAKRTELIEAMAALTEVKASTAVISAYSGDTINGANTEDIQENITINDVSDTENLNKYSVSGISNWVTNFNEVAAGNHVAISIAVPQNITPAAETSLVTIDNKTYKTEDISAGKTIDITFNVTGKEMTKTVTIDWDGNGDEYTQSVYTLVFSDLTLNSANSSIKSSKIDFSAADSNADVSDKAVSDIQKNLQVETSGNDVVLSGKSYWSGSGSEAGNYVAVSMAVPNGVTPDSTAKITVGGKDYTFAEFNNNVLNVLLKVAGKDAETAVTVDWDGDGENYSSRTYTIKYTGLDLEKLIPLSVNFVDCDILSGNGSYPRKESGGNIGYTEVDDFKMLFINPGSLKNCSSAKIYVSGGTGNSCAGTVEAYLTSAKTLDDFNVSTSAKVVNSTIIDNSSAGWGKEVATDITVDASKATEEQVNLVFVVTRASGARYAGGNFHKVEFINTVPTAKPTSEPTSAPTSEPTSAPTSEPTAAPTSEPTSAPTAAPTAEPCPETLNFSNITEMSDANGNLIDLESGNTNPRIEAGGNIGYTGVSKFMTMFKNPGSLIGYTGVSVAISGGAGKKCGGTFKLYLTSAGTLTEMTDSNSTAITGDVTIDNSSTGWGNTVNTVTQIDLSNVRENEVNLVVEVIRADGMDSAGGNFHTIDFTKAEPKAVTISSDITNGSISADKASALEGETVTLTVTPDEGNTLSEITISGSITPTKVNDTTYTFKMPANAVTVSAAFASGSSVTVINPDVIKGGFISADKTSISAKDETINLTAKLWDGITTVDWNVRYGENGVYKQAIMGTTDMTGSTNIQSAGNTAWLMYNIWDLYQTTGDKELLANDLYPIMRKAANFYTQYLYTNERKTTSDKTKYPDGYYYTTWSGRSPEQGPTHEGIKYDLQLVAGMYDYTIKAAETLGVDADKVAAWKEIRDHLEAPVELGADGQIKEWAEETSYNKDASGKDLGDPVHRHISHLVGLYPGTLINRDTPELLNGAKVVLQNRGDDSTGWSCSNKFLLWARCLEGDKALELFRFQLAQKTYANLFDTHAPFQIDGNFGSAAGVMELLMQSHTGDIYILPALPSAWNKGEISGIKAKNGATVSIKWNNGKATEIKIVPAVDGDITIGYEKDNALTLNGADVTFTNNEYTIANAVKGTEYVFTSK